MPLLTITSSTYDTVPAGTYKAKFKEFQENVETSRGKAYRWRFTITEGKHAGVNVSELSDAGSLPSTKNKTGRFLVAISGKPLADGTEVDPDHYVGRPYLLIVEPKENGGSKITTFSPMT
jgi:hypothetical protein